MALVPVSVLLVSSALDERRQAALRVQEAALRLARLAATNQGQLVLATHHLLAGLAQLREVQRRDAAGCGRLFAELLREYSLYANLGAIRPDGELFCSAVPFEGRIRLGDRAYFRRAVATRQFAIGEYQIGRATRRATLNVAYPALDERGDLRAVVFAALDLAWLNRLVAGADLPPGSTFTVIDQNGTVLVRHPEPAAWIGRTLPREEVRGLFGTRSGVAEAAIFDGVPRLFGFTPLLDGRERGDLLVAIGIPRRTVLAQIDRALRQNLAWLAGIGLLTALAAGTGAHLLVMRPVDVLIGATRRLAAGDLAARTGLAGHGGELGQLAAAFDRMGEALQARQAEIERHYEALLRSEKLAELGRLAAGVAHELRNPLTVVGARAQLLERAAAERPPQPEVIAGHVRALQDAAERMGRIVQGLSSYSRPARSAPARLDVLPLLAGVQELVAYQARKQDVAVRVEAPPAVPAVLADRSEMTQVLVNLAMNAIEAMGAGGRLTLRAHTGPGTVLLEVADTGPGIPPAVMERIWEPFYTTKPEGTGLGLSIVRALVDKQPGAAIAVESVPGRGTTFRITLPAAEAGAPPVG